MKVYGKGGNLTPATQKNPLTDGHQN